MELKLSGGRVLKPAGKALVMGILNVTPDSFYAESRKPGLDEAVDSVGKMIDEGAEIIDIGGESSRPGAKYIEAEEEADRIVPVIEAVRGFTDTAISIDTRKSSVAAAALDAGADIINDISALKDDPALGMLAAERDVPVILMHKRGDPENMQINPQYTDAVQEIIDELELCVKRARSFGISRERIILDPGIGFGKRLKDNLAILGSLPRFREMGFQLLIGLSRKSFIGTVTGAEPEDRLAGTLAANMYSVMGGAGILRVHDVKETVWMLRMLSAMEKGE